MILFIDIRDFDEVTIKRFDNSPEYNFLNIPMNMIGFQTQMIITLLEYYDEIYIVCHSGVRAQNIKDTYFNDYVEIKVSQNLQFINLIYGVNMVSVNDSIDMIIYIIGDVPEDIVDKPKSIVNFNYCYPNQRFGCIRYVLPIKNSGNFYAKLRRAKQNGYKRI